MNEKRKRRRALLLAALSTGVLVLLFLYLVTPPPVPKQKPTGYLLVEFGPGGQNLPAPKAPKVAAPEAKKPPQKEVAKPKLKEPKPAKPPAKLPAPEPKPAAKKPPAEQVAKPSAKPPAPKPKPVAKKQAAKPKTPPPPKPKEAAPKPKPVAEPKPVKASEPELPVAKPAAAPTPEAKVEKPEATPEKEPMAAPPPKVEKPKALPEEPAATPTPKVEKPEALPDEKPVPVATPVEEQAAAALAPVPREPTPPKAEAEAKPPAAPALPKAPAPEIKPTPPLEKPELPKPPALAGGEQSPIAPPRPAPPTPQPGPEAGGAKGPGQAHYERRFLSPLLVSVDNAHAAFPQEGFGLALRVYEVPVEGGVTRLLFETRGGERGRVGPVRSARVYMLELTSALGAFLVHVGGSPLAQKIIDEKGFVTFDGLYDRERFSRDKARRPPHNAYADLGKVRAELKRLGLDKSVVVRGAAYLPAEDAPPGERVAARFAPDYKSVFVYEAGRYRWYRNGAKTGVLVDAVVVLFVDARVRDEVGRLDLDLKKGGEGALYLKGKYVPLRWRLVKGGIELKDAEGNKVDLTPYKVWYLFLPPWAKLE